MSSIRARHRLAAALAAMAAAGAAMAPAAADTSPSPEPDLPPVAVTLTHLAPLAPQPGQTLRLSGTLVNRSSEAQTGLVVHLELSRSHLGSRSEFDSYADTPDGSPPADAVDVPTATATLATGELGAGRSERFTVAAPVDDLQLPQAWQVYEIAVVVTGDTPLGAQPVGQLRTFLPSAPVTTPGAGEAIRLAWLWPLVDTPHRTTAAAWNDDTLATELASGGRLDGLVRAGAEAAAQHNPAPPVRRHRHRHRPAPPPPPPRPDITPVPVTWAIDPMLVEDARMMASGYRVASGADGTGTEAARSWLAQLTASARTGEVLALPYADPDITAAVHAGLTLEAQVAATTGQEILRPEFGSVMQNYAWPPGGYVDQRALDALFASGTSAIVLDSGAVPVVGGPPSETPGARTVVKAHDENLPAVLYDDTLSAAVDDGAANDSLGPLTVQRVMSELLMIQAELPADRRSVVIAPARQWTPTPAYAAALLAASGRVPWVTPVRLPSVVDGPVYDKVPREPTVSYPSEQRDLQLSPRYLHDVNSLNHRIDALVDILPSGDAQAQSFRRALLRLLSAAWRTRPLLAHQFRLDLDKEVTDTSGKVYIASRAGSLVTLTSHNGTVPVTVANDLDTPVRVRVQIDPSPRLVVTSGARTDKTIPPHRLLPVDIRATAKTSGIFPLTVTLYTPHGHRFSAPVELIVRSTAYGTTALLITGGAMLVLLIAVAVRLVRRARGRGKDPQPAP